LEILLIDHDGARLPRGINLLLGPQRHHGLGQLARFRLLHVIA
jgi:hypothetical protein